MASALDVIRAVNPPRSAFLDYPLGHTTGKPLEPGLQRNILAQALTAFESLKQPGSVLALDFRWSESDEWKRNIILERRPRLGTPQYQTDGDRIKAERH